MAEEELNQPSSEMTDEEALAKIAAAMKDTNPSQDEKTNVHTFLRDVVVTPDVTRVGNLRDDKEMNELGMPNYHVRGSKDMALIAFKIMNNPFYAEYFETEAQTTLATSLSRAGFLVRQASVTTKQISDSTPRRKINKGWFGKQQIEESGGDITQK
jgi:hypothetical protein